MNGKYSRRKFLVSTSILAAAPGAIYSLDRSSDHHQALKGPAHPVNIGLKRQLFVGDFLIEGMRKGARLLLHHPKSKEIVMLYDKPWEGSYSGEPCIFKDGNLYRMFYSGVNYIVKPGKIIDDSHPFFSCYAESDDGINWRRPDLGLYEFNGSTKNNILNNGGIIPFKDDAPDVPLDAKYKAVTGDYRGLYIAKSPDGIRNWTRMTEKPVITNGAFDSQNVVFWDGERKEYRAYWRSKTANHVRGVRTAASKDLLTWYDESDLQYVDSPEEELYTNAVKNYPRAPDYILGFPVRYIERSWASPSMYALPELANRKMRASARLRFGTAITESLFMASKDGILFKRWNEAFLRPGIERPGTWIYGHQFLAWQMVETKSDLTGAPDELSFYAGESTWTGDSSALRRYTLRMDGFVSVNAPMSGGELITKPLIFEGDTLALNFSTSAAGGVKVEILDEHKKVIPEYAMDNCPEIFGDSISRQVMWKGNAELSRLAGKQVQLRFILKDADLYSFKFSQKRG